MRRAFKAGGALVVLLVLVVGIPALLAATIGNPLHGWTDLKAGDLTNEVVIDLLAAVVWIAWAQFALSVLVEAIGAIRHVPHPTRIPLVPGFSQHLAHTLIASVLLVGTATIALATPLHAVAATPTAAPAAVSVSQTAAPHEASSHGGASVHAATLTADRQVAAPATQPAQQAPATTTYVVPDDGKGPDTYWDIAEAHCGGGEHWTQVWDLNRGRTQPDGAVMNDPGLLKPGWTVLLPATATSTSPALAASTHVESVTVHADDTLSAIAQDHGLSDWHQAWDVSKGMAEPGGQTFNDPDDIRPGWTVQIPIASTATTTPTTTPPVTPPVTSTPPAPTPPVTPPVTTPAAPSTTPATPSTTAPSSPATPAVSATPSAPAATPAHQQPAAARPAVSASRSVDLPMVAFAGGGVLLAGVSLAAMIRYRRRQFRWRGAGRTIGATPPSLVNVERQLLSAGSAGIADVTWLNEALRSLVHALAAHDDARLPDVVAARMTSEVLELVLTNAQPNPPAPWVADETATRWVISREDTLPYDPADRQYHFAPFPTLASVGYTTKGEHWLLDLERVAAMSLSGDPERCLNLARFLAAELAHNAWSEMLQVTLVGFGREMAEINPDRLTYTEDFTKAIASLHHQLDSVHDVLDGAEVDLLTGRLHDVMGDAWAPHVLLIAPHLAEDTVGLDELLSAMREQRSRTAVALVLADDPDHADGTRWQLTIDEQGTLRIPALDVELIAQQIPADEAADLAQLLALAATTQDRPVPASPGQKPWEVYADAAGGLRREVLTDIDRDLDADLDADLGATFDPKPTQQRQAPLETVVAGGAADIPVLHLAESSPWMTNSVLPLPKRTYLEHTAATEDDVDALAPRVTEEIRRRIEDADPGLDADLAAWRDPECTRPKVQLLGPVVVTAQGPLPTQSPRLAWNTEVVAYLATRPTGVSAERFGTDLWPGEPDIAGKTKIRQAVMIVRKWLGEDPDGKEYLPKGTTTSATGGMARYEIVDALVDAELFRRLRLRGLARGADGIADLWAALELVIGIPFDVRRPGGYSWLAENPLDHYLSGMIADTANTVATHHLGAGEPERAAAAAQVALRAGSSEDTPLMNLMTACDALGNWAEGDAYLQRIMANHDAEVEEDLPPHTYQIISRRNRRAS